jgi:hypothetical protein
MKFIDTFRFTSTDRLAIESIADHYGGKCIPWEDPSAGIKGQWQVITGAKEIDVLLPPVDALSVWMETWSGGGLVRRCDGDKMDRPIEAPCRCLMDGRRTCIPTTRLRVLLPDIPFGGTWRLQSHGKNAADELTSMEGFISSLNAGGNVVQAVLYVEARTTKFVDKNGKQITKHYVVPGLRLKHSVTEIMSGSGTMQELGSTTGTILSLPSGVEPEIEAEIVDQDEDERSPALKIVERHAESNELVEKINDRIAQCLAAFPASAKSDEELLGNVIHKMSGGKLSALEDVPETNRVRIIRYLDACLAGKSTLP